MDLALLEAHGVIERHGPSYRDRGGAATLKSTGIADNSQLGIEALRMLAEDILPGLDDPKAARVAAATLTVSENEAQRFVEDMWAFLKNRWGEAAKTSGPAGVSIVLGLAKQPGQQPGAPEAEQSDES